jgi:hypothetical protein
LSPSFLQSLELRNQRIELQESQAVCRDSAKAQENSHKALRDQGELMERQAELMKQQAESLMLAAYLNALNTVAQSTVDTSREHTQAVRRTELVIGQLRVRVAAMLGDDAMEAFEESAISKEIGLLVSTMQDAYKAFQPRDKAHAAALYKAVWTASNKFDLLHPFVDKSCDVTRVLQGFAAMMATDTDQVWKFEGRWEEFRTCALTAVDRLQTLFNEQKAFEARDQLGAE